MRELNGFFARELPEGMMMLDPSDVGWRGAMKRFFTRLFRRRARGA
jgi:hypothetical protein